MRFLADMGVSWRVLEHLRAAGHDAVHLREEGLQRLPDEAVFQKAIDEQRIVLAFDLDFGEIAARCRGPVVSVILFRLTDTTSEHVASRLDSALTLAGDALAAGAIVVVEEDRCRIRSLPIEPLA